MIETLRQIVEKSLERLSQTVITHLPPLLAGLTILLAFYLLAVFARWLLIRIFKGAGVDRFLHQSGLSSLFDRSGRLRATRLVAGIAYWLILGAGFMTALSAFDTALTSKMIETMVFLLPKLITAAAIVLIGAWLGQYFGRSALIWACNEEIPYARTLSAAVRMVIIFVSVVVAADHLDFARSVFLAAFVLLVGGAVLAASIALGLGGKETVHRHLNPGPQGLQEEPQESKVRSLWNHL